MPIAQFEGKALVFNNGVVDVQQDGVSVVDENKIAHITTGGGGSGISEGRVNELIDIKINELDFASEGDISEAIESLDIISEGRVNDLIDVKINELDFASEGDIAQAISELDIPHYTAGKFITISSEGVISSSDNQAV